MDETGTGITLQIRSTFGRNRETRSRRDVVKDAQLQELDSNFRGEGGRNWG